MKRLPSSLLFCLVTVFALAASLQAKTITVNTKNAVAGAGEVNLAMAIGQLEDGDTIHFNIPGDGPHYIETPTGGYPLITKNNVTIDGYSQPGATPNTNPILAANNAKIKIVLDSRNGNYTSMAYEPSNGQAGYGDSEFAILGIFNAKNVTIRGLCTLGGIDPNGAEDRYHIAIARNLAGEAIDVADGAHINGCWIGVDLDGKTVHGGDDGITAFRHRDDTIGNSARLPSNKHIIGVKPGSTNPRSEFNIIVGFTIPVILEGQAHRISGNFLGVLADGVSDYIVPFAEPGRFAESHIEIGRGASNLVIGTDGDGVNDADERNVMGGVVTNGSGNNAGAQNLNGYTHVIEVYSLSSSPGPERTNIRISGNYIGVGVDGMTRFTNGVPAMNGSAVTDSQYWIGSDYDGVSDDVEGNVIFNNYPRGLFFPEPDFPGYNNDPRLGFFDQPSNAAYYAVRGNVTVNNFPFPVNPGRDGGGFFPAYFGKVMADVSAGVQPVISPASNAGVLKGTVPAPKPEFPHVMIDVYLPDPEGLVNGKAVEDANLPNGWVQGLRYLGTFTEGSAADMDPAPNQFAFNIAGWNLAAGTQVTLTANYSSQPPGTHNPAKTLTSMFAAPVELGPFLPGGIATAGLTRVVSDRILFNTEQANLNNWEPYATVVGTSTFIIEANTFADDAQFANQRYVVAFQPAAGGNSGLGEGFFADNGTPYKGQINLSRQNGNPGRVAGDKRPGAVHFITGGEASPHGFQEFLSDNRWTVNGIYTDVNRYTVVQTFALNPSTLAQMSTGKAFDPVNGKNTAAFSGNVPEVARFGGDLAGLDNGNFVVVIDDRSNMIEPTRAATAAIITPTGEVVKGGFSIGPGEIWSNVAAYRGGFCVRLGGVLYFYDNEGNLRGQVPQNASEVAFDGGRGDGTRLASHINSHYVYLAGAVTEPDPNDPTGPTIKVVRVAAFDARDFTFVAQAQVNEASFTPAIDRSNLAVDALNRVAVAYEARPTDFDAAQTVVRVLAFDGTTKSFTALTPSFFCFNNNGQTGFRTIRPSVAMTTRQICVAAKGEINSQDKPELGPDTLSQTTFYTVFSHPAPADDPTQSAVADLEFTAIANVGNAVRLTWEGGAGPFLLQRKASLSDAQWENLLTTPSRTAVVLRETSTAFYRLVDGAQNTVIPLSVSLSGDAEKPNAVTTAGTGMGTLILEGNTLRYRIPYSNLSSAASAAHIHGPATSTEATGVMKGLTGASGTSGVLSGSIDLTDEQKGHLLAGRTYVNVHTANHGGGEIRGQIVQSKLRATLSGAAERPNPVDTPGTGSGVIWVTGNQITFNISYSGLKAAATAGHIHGPATPEQATGVLFGFTGVSGTEGTIAGFGTVAPNVLGAIADGLTYVNIHTSAHTGGEIRGQIVP